MSVPPLRRQCCDWSHVVGSVLEYRYQLEGIAEFARIFLNWLIPAAR